ncbi:MAG: hypothetical protein KDB24_16325 [Microthrixaceae bacterium]|nr:hypothetical protein [Microthrixaceae bacterium]
MSVPTFVMVLAAAMLHAAWNLAMKDSDDRLVAAWAIMGTGGLLSLPVLVAVGPPPPEALGCWRSRWRSTSPTHWRSPAPTS